MRELTTDSTPNEMPPRGRGMLLLLLGAFILPLLIVAAMYLFQWHPGGASHGQLVSPPKALQLADMQTLQGGRFNAAQWNGKWSMVYLRQQPCDATCAAQLYTLRQVHASLSKEIDRVQRILLVNADPKHADLARIQAQYPDLIILAGPGVEALARQFRADDLYLVDPLGNLMMHYPPGYEARGLRKDLMRLLTYSWTG